jgi:hypothetical protein
VNGPAFIQIVIARCQHGGCHSLGRLYRLASRGRGNYRFAGRLNGRPLPPDRYRATLTATSTPRGRTSKPLKISFKILG